MSFSGKWHVVGSPDFDDEYLHEDNDPYIRLEQKGERISGSYTLGNMSGTIDGRLDTDTRIIFSFEGMDEMDEVNGAGIAVLEDNQLILTLMYHMGDDYTFECEK